MRFDRSAVCGQHVLLREELTKAIYLAMSFLAQDLAAAVLLKGRKGTQRELKGINGDQIGLKVTKRD